MFFFLDLIHLKTHFSSFSSFILLYTSPFMNISSHSSTISLFVLPSHLSAAYTFTVILYHCCTSAPRLRHNACSHFPRPLPLPFLSHFQLSVRLKIISEMISQQWQETLKILPVRAVCAFMRLISLANDYIYCRLTSSSTSMGHIYCPAEAAAERLLSAFLASSHPK